MPIFAETETANTISDVESTTTTTTNAVLTPGCRQVILPPGMTKVPHMLHYQNGNEIVQKGIRSILTERGLWDRTNPPKLALARALLRAQPDFSEQMEWMAEIVTGAGHNLIYLPNFIANLISLSICGVPPRPTHADIALTPTRR